MSTRLAALCLAALCSTATAAAPPPPDLARRVDATIDRAIADGRIVGAVVIVLQDGAPLYQRAAGLADREARRPMRADAIFRLASLSKAIVSTAALVLVDRGTLGLEDPVTKWLPGFRPAMDDGSRPVITVRQLLTHTAGLSYPFLEPDGGPYHRAQVSSGIDQPGLGLEEELSRISSAGLLYAPGHGWSYSVGIDVLGAVIAKATGRPLPEAVHELVTGPLRMADTGFSVTDPHRLAVPYRNGPGHALRMTDPQDVTFPGIGVLRFAPGRIFDAASFPSGGAGMVGTAADYARLLEAVRVGGHPILAAATAHAMQSNQVGALQTVLGPGWGFGYGGAVLTDARAARTPQGDGTWTWSGVYGNTWFVDPQRRLVVVALTNTAPEGDSGAFPEQLRDAVYGRARE